MFIRFISMLMINIKKKYKFVNKLEQIGLKPFEDLKIFIKF